MDIGALFQKSNNAVLLCSIAQSDSMILNLNKYAKLIMLNE